MNSLDGRVKANAAIVPAGMSSAVSVYVTDTTDVVIDIDGFFAPTGQSTLMFSSAGAVPCGRHPQEQLPAGPGPAALVRRSSARLPRAQRNFLQHPSERPSLFAELHGDPVIRAWAISLAMLEVLAKETSSRRIQSPR